MFCQQCGTSLADDAAACPSCSTPVHRAPVSRASAMAGTVKSAYSNALAALKGFVGNPVGRLPQPVTLAAIRGLKEFNGHPLVRMPRLSVMPVTDVQWKAIERAAKA